MTETPRSLSDRPESGIFNRLLRTIDAALGVSQVVMPRLALLERRQTALNDALAEAWRKSDAHVARFSKRQNEFANQFFVFNDRIAALGDDQRAQLEETRAMQGRLAAHVAELEAVRSEIVQAEQRQQELNQGLAKRVETLVGVLDDHNRLFADIRSDVAAGKDDRAALTARVDAMEGDVAKQATELAAVRSGLETAQDGLADTLKELSEKVFANHEEVDRAQGALGKRIDSIDEDLADQAEFAAALRAAADQSGQAIDGRVSAVETRISAVSDDVVELRDTLSALSASRDGQSSDELERYTALEEGLSAQGVALEDIRSTFDRLDTELAALRESDATGTGERDAAAERLAALESLVAEQVRANEAVHAEIASIRRDNEANFTSAVSEIRDFKLPQSLESLERFVDMMSNEAGRVNQRLVDFDSEFARIDKRIVEHDEAFHQLSNERLARLTDHIEMLSQRLIGLDALTEFTGPTIWPARTASSRVRAPYYIFVCSYGRTATYWLAQLLNEHPDIISSHGPTTPPIVEYEEANPHELDNWVWENMPKFHDMKLRDVLRDMRKVGEAKYYVKVHAYSAFNLFNRLMDEGMTRPVLMANLVRHPVTRVESFAKRWKENAGWNERLRTFLLDWWDEQEPARALRKHLEAKHSVDFTDEANVFFATACLWLRQDREDLMVPMLHVSSERLVSDPDYFAWFLDRLTLGRLAGDREIMEIYRNTGPKNVSAGARPAREVYRGWDDWQREAFDFVANLYDLAPLYSRFPYDLDFGS